MKQPAIPARHLVTSKRTVKNQNPKQGSLITSLPDPQTTTGHRTGNKSLSLTSTLQREEFHQTNLFCCGRWSTGNSRRSVVHPVLSELQFSLQLIFRGKKKKISPVTCFSFCAMLELMPFVCATLKGDAITCVCLSKYGDRIKAPSWLNKSPAFSTFTWVMESVCTRAAIVTWLTSQQCISYSHWEPGWRKPAAILPAWMIHPHCILGRRLLPGASLPVPVLELSLIDTCFGQHLQREKQNPLKLQTPFGLFKSYQMHHTATGRKTSNKYKASRTITCTLTSQLWC